MFGLHVCLVPQKREEGNRSSGTVTDGCEFVSAGN